MKSYAKYLEVDISRELSEISLPNTMSFKNENEKIIIDRGLKKFATFVLCLILILTVLFFFN